MSYRKSYSSQNSLIVMFEKWTRHFGKGREFGALFIDLFKTFDNLQHYLLLTKLNSYIFSYKEFKLISCFLLEGRYKTKINSEHSDWEDLLIGLPQGSVLRSFFINS